MTTRTRPASTPRWFWVAVVLLVVLALAGLERNPVAIAGLVLVVGWFIAADLRPGRAP